ncbi:major facilitator superfamily domain-containing protein [Zychaea mexicana]|uniref:major facilitator superfamily domain-containing protein n=1 Tax=Zychaea mexicana TaxID=64656 RepID=UPI0022FE0715|nr:major facilitator superfamily domain-containing protein [Zychaea mexicana]KAI9497507.1 major facilitator superfamily domain-containing protein [Zychaea mexicana]
MSQSLSEKTAAAETYSFTEKVESTSIASSLEKGTVQNEATFVKSPEEVKLVRKINRIFMPLVGLALFIQFMDKSTLGYAGIMGIYEDTGISHNQFAWLGSVFYVGYLVVQIPNQYCLQRLPISKYLGTIFVVWGISLALTALAHNFAQLAGLRFLLGFFEGTTYPAMFLLIATMYRRSEQIVWYSFMFMCNALCGAFGGLVAYGVAYMHGLKGMSSWKWQFIIWGCLTVVAGVLYFFFLADKPKSRWFFLTPEEEKIVDARTKDNASVQNKDIKKEHIYEALREPRLYCYFLMSLFLNLQNGAVTLFSQQITQQMGFSQLNTILMGIPHGAATIVLLVGSSFFSRRFDELAYVGMIFSAISMVAVILLAAIPPGPAQLAGLLISATTPLYTLMQASISNNVSGYTKKIFYTSANLVAYCIGNFIGPLMMDESTGPRYIPGNAGYAVADFLCILLFGYIRWAYIRENKRRAQLLQEGSIPPPPKNREELDLTDKEDLYFVYKP